MAQLVFDEKSMINGNLFQFEKRLQSSTNRFVTESGAILTTYFSIDDDATTVDRGIQDIDQLFGKKSPIRLNQINDFPLYGTSQATPNNSDEHNVEDINVEGEYIILPSTLIPKQNDFFIINHLQMIGIFQVTSVQYDTMKANGYYKINYRLHSTSDELLADLKRRVIAEYYCELNAIGTEKNPIIRADDFITRKQVERMIAQMIHSYRALFYNERHQCFLFHEQSTGYRLYDMCGSEFMAKYSLMNVPNSNNVIMLHDKLREPQLPLYYNNSIYTWMENDCPLNMLQKFHYILSEGDGYPVSSFARWYESDIKVIQPISLKQSRALYQERSFLEDEQLKVLENISLEPLNAYEKLLHRFIHKRDSLSLKDIPSNLCDDLLNANRKIDIFFYVPTSIFVMRKILRLN
mgnify:CR=1 FL=1